MSGKFNLVLVGTLFEHGEQITVHDRKNLEGYLFSLWKEHKGLWPGQVYTKNSPDQHNYQPFLSFDGNQAKANNYIGFITCNGISIEIYPKVFKFLPNLKKELMHRHLFFWFSYCKRIKFPFNQSFLDNFAIEHFPELIIYLMAKQILETVINQPFLTYEEMEEALSTPRGRINFNRFTKSMSYGRQHLIDCDHEPFIFDNYLNRTIKYCIRLLKAQSTQTDTQSILNEIIFLLDEVEDQVCTVGQLNRLRVPIAFEAYEDVIQSCKMILENQIYSHAEYEMKHWSLLFPMEYIFEDFISGFLKEHFSKDFIIEAQKSDLYLHQNPKTFNLQHDILIINKRTGEKIIIDAKYKPRWNLTEVDNKRGVSQTDMYQMISYAYRRGTDKVLLIYPNSSDKLIEDHVFIIPRADGKEEVKIKVIDVPFWSEYDYALIQERLFDKLKNVLFNNF
ncbi:MAG: hypothetical protein JWQ14_8 [Adhaeribacter sp.]|nr:hypothetical protein [Adhaeribacter sp.]